MSFLMFRQQCQDCWAIWNTSFGIVGMTQIAAPTTACPQCQSTNVKKYAEGWNYSDMLSHCPVCDAPCKTEPSGIGGKRDRLLYFYEEPQQLNDPTFPAHVHRGPLRAALEFYVNEEWRWNSTDLDHVATLRNRRIDPDDERVRVRPVAQDNALILDGSLANPTDSMVDAAANIFMSYLPDNNRATSDADRAAARAIIKAAHERAVLDAAEK